MVAKLECRECGQMNRAGTPCHCGGPKMPAGDGMGSETLAERLRSIVPHPFDSSGPHSDEMFTLMDQAADTLDAKDREIAQWQRVIWDNRCAFVAMRNDLNELFGDMASDEATLRKGPEMSHEYAAIVEAARKSVGAKDREIERLRKALIRCEGVLAYFPEMRPDEVSDAMAVADAALRQP